ncbi:MAG: thiol:disulfide interchange protein DsbA/DsbL [Pseudomonadota bacterium]
MKRISLIAAALLILGACSQDEPVQPAAEDAAIADEEQAAVETVVEETVEDVTDEVVQVVEESASEPSDDEGTIVLAQADTSTPARDWKFKENQHFFRITPAGQKVGGPDKIEVAEVFWYGCGHCYTLEPHVKRWAESIGADVSFVQVPVNWSTLHRTHGQLFYTEQVLAASGAIDDPAAFRETVFQELHMRGNRLGSENAVRSLFERNGVSAEEFDAAWSSFEVNMKLNRADDLTARRWGVNSVPAIIVNGKYRTGAAEAGGISELFEVVDELIERERVR